MLRTLLRDPVTHLLGTAFCTALLIDAQDLPSPWSLAAKAVLPFAFGALGYLTHRCEVASRPR